MHEGLRRDTGMTDEDAISDALRRGLESQAGVARHMRQLQDYADRLAADPTLENVRRLEILVEAQTFIADVFLRDMSNEEREALIREKEELWRKEIGELKGS